MFKRSLQHFCIVLILLCSHRLVADELLIIVAKDSAITKINSRQLERIFRRKTLINQQGEGWVPINLGIDNPLRLAFSKRLFKQRPAEMETFWNIQYFKGISPPYVVTSEEAVLRFVASTPGAIGYINPCHMDSRVRVLMKLTIRENIHSLCKASNKD
jgi:ABC-type phosphate transport system substrate-binding protein